MKKLITLLTLISMIGIFTIGCGGNNETDDSIHVTKEVSTTHADNELSDTQEGEGSTDIYTEVSETLFVLSDNIVDCSEYGYRDIYTYNYNTESSYLIDDQYIILKDATEKKGLYSINGEEILPIKIDEIYYDKYTGGLFKVSKDNEEAYYNKSGEIVCGSMCDYVSDVVDGMFYCRKDDKFFVYSIEGEQISNDHFDNIGEMANGLVVVIRNKNQDGDIETGLLNKDGEFLVEIGEHFIYLGDGEYIIIEGKIGSSETRTTTILDYLGNEVFKEEVVMELSFSSGFYNGTADLSWFMGSFISGYDIGFPTTPGGITLYQPAGEDYIYSDLKIYPNGCFSFFDTDAENRILFNQEGQEIATVFHNGINDGIEYVNNGLFIINNALNNNSEQQGLDNFTFYFDSKGNLVDMPQSEDDTESLIYENVM